MPTLLLLLMPRHRRRQQHEGGRLRGRRVDERLRRRARSQALERQAAGARGEPQEERAAGAGSRSTREPHGRARDLRDQRRSCGGESGGRERAAATRATARVSGARAVVQGAPLSVCLRRVARTSRPHQRRRQRHASQRQGQQLSCEREEAAGERWRRGDGSGGRSGVDRRQARRVCQGSRHGQRGAARGGWCGRRGR